MSKTRRPGIATILAELRRTVKPLFMSMDFGASESLYVSDVVDMSETGQARVHAMFEALREDIHVIGEQERTARLDRRDWSGILMMIHPFDIGDMMSERRGKRPK